MKYSLRLKEYSEDNRFIYAGYVEEIPEGGWYLEHVKWKDRMVFDCRLDVLNYKHHWDKFDHFEIVEEL